MNLAGKVFSRLTVVDLADGAPRRWVCKCECGNLCERKAGHLRHGSKVKSCGCAKMDSIKKAASAAWSVTTKFSHRHKTKLKWIYQNMLNRCHKPGTRRYERYGGRGISVCSEWKRCSTAFFEWAIQNGYRPGLQINRKNNDGNYNPDNCNFVTATEQANNTSRNHFIEWNGARKTVSEWAREIGVNPRALQHRVDRGWNLDRLFMQPFRKRLE